MMIIFIISLFLIVTAMGEEVRPHFYRKRFESGELSPVDGFCADLVNTCPYLNSLNAKPVQNVADGVNLTIVLTPFDFFGIDEIQQTLAMQAVYLFSWPLPPCARWDDDPIRQAAYNESGKITECSFSKEKFWRPKVQLWNGIGAAQRIFDNYGGDVTVNSQGIAFWSARGSYETSCAHSLKVFPFDEFQCEITISGYLGFSTSKQVYFTDNSKIERSIGTFVNDADIWLLLNTSTEIVNEVNGINFNFYFQRKPSFYVTAIFLPTVFLQVMMAGTLCIPSELPDRSGFSVTVFLAFAFLKDSFTAQTPKTSEIMYITIYLVFNNGLAVFVSLWALISCLLANRHKKRLYEKFTGKHYKLISILDAIIFTVVVMAILMNNGLYFGLAILN